MERLTTRHNGVAVIRDKSKLKEAMEKLARYEELEEQGLLLTLPYIAGERVWILYKDKQIEENYVESIQIGEKYDRLCFADGYFYTIWNKDYEEAKKWVYTSKAEAEKALAEMSKDCTDCRNYWQNTDTENECNGQDKICHEFAEMEK